MNSNNQISQKFAMFFTSAKKLTTKRGFFIKLGSAERSQALELMQNLICCNDIITFGIAIMMKGWIKQRNIANYVHFNDFSLPKNKGRP